MLLENVMPCFLGRKMHTKSEILATAGELFSERGYHGTSMRELAKALNMRGASLYSHINSKEEILWEIVNEVADQFLALAEAVPRHIPPEEQLTQLVQGHLKVIARELHYAIVFFHEWKFLEPSLRDQVKAKRDVYEASFCSIIEEGTRQGLFCVANPRLAALFVLSALNWTYQWFRLEGPLSIEQLADQYVVFILRILEDGNNGSNDISLPK